MRGFFWLIFIGFRQLAPNQKQHGGRARHRGKWLTSWSPRSKGRRNQGRRHSLPGHTSSDWPLLILPHLLSKVSCITPWFYNLSKAMPMNTWELWGTFLIPTTTISLYLSGIFSPVQKWTILLPKDPFR